MLSMAFFYFVFLGTEYLFDNRMVLCTDPTGVVLAQSYILGVSVLGFLAYSLIEKQKSKYKNPAAFKAGGFLVSVLTLVGYGMLLTRTRYSILLGTGVFLFLVLGYMGSRAHYRAAVILQGSRHPAKTIGAAYALGLLLQFLNHNLLWGETVEGEILAVSFVVLWVLGEGNLPGKWRRRSDDIPREDIFAGEKITVKNSRMAGAALFLTIVLMTCIFATLDNAVTLAHAAGTMDIGQWPRLFLAFSGLLAGVLFDLHSGRYRGMIMYAVTILSTICVLIIESGGPFLPGLLIFYMSAGFFVVFFTNGFIQLSYRMRDGKLWAGMGRVANNLGAVITGVASVSLLTGDSHVLTAVLALVLFVLISVSLLWYYNCTQIVIKKAEGAGAGNAGQPDWESGADDPKEMESREISGSQSRMQRFAECFGLTEREQEVLQILLLSDDGMQEIADSLFVSRAMLYRHVSTLNEKTGTRSRIGLIQFYSSTITGKKIKYNGRTRMAQPNGGCAFLRRNTINLQHETNVNLKKQTSGGYIETITI